MSDAKTIELTKGCYVELNDGRVRGPLTNRFWKGRIQPSFSLEFNHDPELKPGWTTDGKYLGGKLIGPSLYDVKRVVSAKEAARLRSMTAFCVDPSVDLDEPKVPVYLTREQYERLMTLLDTKQESVLKQEAVNGPWPYPAKSNLSERSFDEIRPALKEWRTSLKTKGLAITYPSHALDVGFLAGYNAALRNEIRPAIPASEKPQGGLSDINLEELAETLSSEIYGRPFAEWLPTEQASILAKARVVRNHLCAPAPGYEAGQHPAAVHSIDDEARA
jgi:hypothetical protein